jgi:phytoene dehydrogenase-like protein
VSRVVVVGAGVGGLAAAARLAAQGHEVTVCESGDDVGGKLGLVVADVPGLGGFRFDTGPSL